MADSGSLLSVTHNFVIINKSSLFIPFFNDFYIAHPTTSSFSYTLAVSINLKLCFTIKLEIKSDDFSLFSIQEHPKPIFGIYKFYDKNFFFSIFNIY